jgi:hypothetical protein
MIITAFSFTNPPTNIQIIRSYMLIRFVQEATVPVAKSQETVAKPIAVFCRNQPPAFDHGILRHTAGVSPTVSAHP